MSDRAGMISDVPRRSGYDQAALKKLLERQEQVISRSQALACGMTPAVLRRHTDPGGPWQRLLPGVYLTGTGTPTSDQREITALRYAGGRSVITRLTALRPACIRSSGRHPVTT